MRASADFLKKLDDWRRVQPDLPPRSEAIRRIVEQALSSDEAAPTTLFALLQRFFEANPERISYYGGRDGWGPAEMARALVFDDDYTGVGKPAGHLLESFEGEDDPIAQEIVKLLKPIATGFD